LDDIKFVIKTFLLTLVVIALMQIKVGGSTIEGKAYAILAESKLTDFLNYVARGIVQLVKEAKAYSQDQFNKSQLQSGSNQK
jgi:hypothetical protein